MVFDWSDEEEMFSQPSDPPRQPAPPPAHPRPRQLPVDDDDEDLAIDVFNSEGEVVTQAPRRQRPRAEVDDEPIGDEEEDDPDAIPLDLDDSPVRNEHDGNLEMSDPEDEFSDDGLADRMSELATQDMFSPEDSQPMRMHVQLPPLATQDMFSPDESQTIEGGDLGSQESNPLARAGGEEEPASPSTPVDTSMDEPTLRALFAHVFTTHRFNSRDVQRAAEICKRAGEEHLAQSPVLAIYSEAVARAMEMGGATGGGAEHDADGGVDAADAIARFCCAVALGTRRIDSHATFAILRHEIDAYKYHCTGWPRARACRMIGWALEMESKMGERGEEGNGDGDDADRESCASHAWPAAAVVQWTMSLTERLMDKEPFVRAAAVWAVSRIPAGRKTCLDHQGRRFAPNTYVVRSLRDVCASARLSAAGSLSLHSPPAVAHCLRVLEGEEDNDVSILLATRLIRDVHVRSLQPQQRVQLVRTMIDGGDELRSMLTGKLIPQWLVSAEEERTRLERERDGEEEEGSQEEHRHSARVDDASLLHPSGLLWWLNVEGGDEEREVTRQLLHVAVECYVNTLGGGSSQNVVEKFLLQLREYYSDDAWMARSGALHSRNLVEAVESCPDPSLLLRQLTVHCVVVGECCRLSGTASAKDAALRRLLPEMNHMGQVLMGVLTRWLSPSSSVSTRAVAEQCVLAVMRLLEKMDKTDDCAMKAWRAALEAAMSSPSVCPSRSLVDAATHQLMHYMCRFQTDYEDFATWCCYQIEEMLSAERGEESAMEKERGEDEKEMDLEDGQRMDMGVEKVAESPATWRCCVLLRAVLRREEVEKMSVLLQTAFDKLIDSVVTSAVPERRRVGCELIGLAAARSEQVLRERAHVLRHAIEIDAEEQRATAVTCLRDVLTAWEPPLVAAWLYADVEETEREQKMVALVETAVKEESVSVRFAACDLVLSSVLRWPQLTWPHGIALVWCAAGYDDSVRAMFASFLAAVCQRGEGMLLHVVMAFLLSLDEIESAMEEEADGVLRGEKEQEEEKEEGEEETANGEQDDPAVELPIGRVSYTKGRARVSVADMLTALSAAIEAAGEEKRARQMLLMGVLRRLRQRPEGGCSRQLVHSLPLMRIDLLSNRCPFLLWTERECDRVAEVLSMCEQHALSKSVTRFGRSIGRLLKEKEEGDEQTEEKKPARKGRKKKAVVLGGKEATPVKRVKKSPKKKRKYLTSSDESGEEQEEDREEKDQPEKGERRGGRELRPRLAKGVAKQAMKSGQDAHLDESDDEMPIVIKQVRRVRFSSDDEENKEEKKKEDGVHPKEEPVRNAKEKEEEQQQKEGKPRRTVKRRRAMLFSDESDEFEEVEVEEEKEKGDANMDEEDDVVIIEDVDTPPPAEKKTKRVVWKGFGWSNEVKKEVEEEREKQPSQKSESARSLSSLSSLEGPSSKGSRSTGYGTDRDLFD